MKRIICGLLICLVIVSMCSACGSNSTSAKASKFSLPDEFVKLDNVNIAENDNFTLIWDEQYKKVILKDKHSENVWSTTPIDANNNGVDEFGFPIEGNPRVNSPILIKFINSKTQITEQSMGYTQSINRNNISVESIEHGIAVTYYFEDEQISVPVNYILTNKGFDISVDTRNITQGKNEVYSISLAPYLCSVGCDVKDGYLFVPSGKGALIYPDAISQEGTYYSEPIYGTDAALSVYTKITNEKNINLPVYGYKSGNQGGLVIIESGAEYASLSGYIGSSDIKYSNIGPEFQLRGTDNLKPSSFSLKRGYNPIYADSLVQDEIKLSFIALSGDSANYNSMAKEYRDYLISNGSLKADKKDESLLHLKMLGAVYEDKSFLGIPYKSLFALTTLDEVEEITSEIDSATNIKLSIELAGYGKSGLDVGKLAGDYEVSSKLGSIRQLKELQASFSKNNISMYFDFDIVTFSKSGNSWSYRNDVPKGPTGLKVYKHQYDTAIRSRIMDEEYALLSRENLISSADKLIKNINKWDLQGIGLDTLSYITYSDYSNIKYYSKGNMSKDVSEIISKYKKSEYKILANNANSYAACLADEVTDTPIQSSKYDVFGDEIPFYQMVFKGYVSMTSETLNTSSNPSIAILSAIEGGCGLSYTIIHDYDTALVTSFNKNLHNSVYSGLKENLFNQIKDLEDFYHKIEGQSIKAFEILPNDLHKTVFENGLVLYTNHSEKTAVCEFGEIEKFGYIYKGGEQ